MNDADLRAVMETDPKLLTVSCEWGQHKSCRKGRHNGCDSPHLHWCQCPCHPYTEPVSRWYRFGRWLGSKLWRPT